MTGLTPPPPHAEQQAALDEKIQHYYAGGAEAARLTTRSVGGQIEGERIRAELAALPAPSRILDVGGGTGVHTAWLAERFDLLSDEDRRAVLDAAPALQRLADLP